MRKSPVSFIAGLAPWFAPAIPAYFAVANAQRYLLEGSRLDVYFVWIVGLAVELVGLSAVHTTLEFWAWNSEGKHKDKAPVWLAGIAAIFYVATVLAVNAALELWVGTTVRVVAKAMLSTLTLPAALIIGLRAMHEQRKEQANAEANERKAERQAERERKANERANEQRTNKPEQARRTRIERTPNERLPRTNIPQPVANGENEQGEQPLGFPTNEQGTKRERLLAFIQENGEHMGPTELAKLTGMSKGYISDVLNGKA